MPIVPAFSISQSGLTPGSITVTDSSTGSDVAITQRRIFFQNSQGEYIVVDGTTTDYEVWSYADAAKTFALLETDQSLSITLQWLDVSNAVLYTLTQLFAFPQFNKNFFYELIQQQALTPAILQDKVYFANIATYWMSIIAGIQAIEIGADIAASQANFDRATYMMENQTSFF